jgi:hypothetical protein
LRTEEVESWQTDWALRNYARLGVPVAGYGPHPTQPNITVIVLNLPGDAAPAPDWRSAPPAQPRPRPRSASWPPAINMRGLISWLMLGVIVVSIGYLFVTVPQTGKPTQTTQAGEPSLWDRIDAVRLPWEDAPKAPAAKSAPGEPVVEATGWQWPSFEGAEMPWDAARQRVDDTVEGIKTAVTAGGIVLVSVALMAFVIWVQGKGRGK